MQELFEYWDCQPYFTDISQFSIVAYRADMQASVHLVNRSIVYTYTPMLL